MNMRNIVLIAIVVGLGVFGAISISKIEPGKSVGMEHGHGEHETNHEGHEGHEGHDDHDSHSDGEVEKIAVNPSAMKDAGVKLYKAGAKTLRPIITLPGEITLNQDAVMHVSPQLSGTVSSVEQRLGDSVAKGDLLAVLHSRDLAQLIGRYLGSSSNLEILETLYNRESKLWKARSSAEQDFLAAKGNYQQAKTNVDIATQELLAIGITKKQISAWAKRPPEDPAKFEIYATMDGQIVQKHISLGEYISVAEKIFTIADLSTVWGEVTVYAKDRAIIKKGQQVAIKSEALAKSTTGIISYISPLLGKQTQSSQARVVIENKNRDWYPGLFVSVEINIGSFKVPLAVPTTALQEYDGNKVVFVKNGRYIQPSTVTLGRLGSGWVEVTSGLTPGQVYVAKNSFLIKADLGKASAAHNH